MGRCPSPSLFQNFNLPPSTEGLRTGCVPAELETELKRNKAPIGRASTLGCCFSNGNSI
jgi:hypothetical protein